MTPDELRSLADEATPGNGWNALYETADGRRVLREERPIARTDAQARLIALAPDLARLCADLGEALAEASEMWGGEDSLDRLDGCYATLAKLSELKT